MMEIGFGKTILCILALIYEASAMSMSATNLWKEQQQQPLITKLKMKIKNYKRQQETELYSEYN